MLIQLKHLIKYLLYLLQARIGLDVPESCLLYVILSPAGPYFSPDKGFAPISLLADPQWTRACRGGAGAYKLGR